MLVTQLVLNNNVIFTSESTSPLPLPLVGAVDYSQEVLDVISLMFAAYFVLLWFSRAASAGCFFLFTFWNLILQFDTSQLNVWTFCKQRISFTVQKRPSVCVFVTWWQVGHYFEKNHFIIRIKYKPEVNHRAHAYQETAAEEETHKELHKVLMWVWKYHNLVKSQPAHRTV